MKKYLIILALFLMLIPVFAENQRLDDQYIGATAGLSAGIGLTYRYWPEEWGVQATFMPYWDKILFGSQLGVAGFRTLYEGKITRLFLYGAGNYVLTAGCGSVYDENLGKMVSDNNFGVGHDWGIGFGPGFEVILFDHIVADLMLGYGYSTLMNGVSFTAEAGLYYRF